MSKLALETLSRLTELALDSLVETFERELRESGVIEAQSPQEALMQFEAALGNPGLMAGLVQQQGDNYANYVNEMMALRGRQNVQTGIAVPHNL